MVSSFDLLDFASRIWSVMNGLWILELEETVLRGACLSMMVVRTWLKWSRYELAEVRVLGIGRRADELISWQKAWMSMVRNVLTVFVIRGGLGNGGTERVDRIERWSDTPGSLKVTLCTRLEEVRVMSRSSVWEEV